MTFTALHDAADETAAAVYLDGVLLGRVEGQRGAERLVKVLHRELAAVGLQVTRVHQSVCPVVRGPLAIRKERGTSRTTDGRFIFRHNGRGYGVVITPTGPVEGHWSRP